MGLEAAKALARRGGWHLHLLHLNAERGKQAASEVGNATFHKVNVLDYDSLANVVQEVYDTEGRLDFYLRQRGNRRAIQLLRVTSTEETTATS